LQGNHSHFQSFSVYLPAKDNIMRKAALFGASLVCLAAAGATAQMSPADQAFATKAASGGLTEVSLGKLAIKNANAPQVRQFGQQMVTDHTQANQQLQ